jgi:hypothetical protein
VAAALSGRGVPNDVTQALRAVVTVEASVQAAA